MTFFYGDDGKVDEVEGTWPYHPEEVALQRLHDDRRRSEQGHDQISCVCCCRDCKGEWATRATRGPG